MAGLGFLSPLFLLGGLAVAVPVFLHLLRQRADPVQPFTAVQLLRRSRVEQAHRRRLRDVLLLLLRATALIVLTMAFARPYLPGRTPLERPVTVVLADVSGSISDAGRTDRLRALARAAVDQAPAGHLVALLQFAAGVDVLVAPTGNRGVVRSAADRLTPAFSTTSYRAGLGKAAELISHAGGDVAVITDLQASGWSDGPNATLPPDVTVTVADVGPPPPDIAVVGVDLDDRGRATAHLRGTASPRPVQVRFEVNGSPAATTAASLNASGTADASASVTVKRGDAVRVSVTDPSGLSADDERWVVAGGGDRPAILVVTSPGAADRQGLYVLRALQALDGPRALNVAVRSADRLQAAGMPPSTAAAVVLGTSGLDRRGMERVAQYVRDGGGLVIAAGPAVTPELLSAGFGDDLPRLGARSAPRSALSLVAVDTRHPALSAFAQRSGALSDARFSRSAHLLGTDTSAVLARFDSGDPAIVAAEYGKGRVVVLASDLDNRWNDLVLQPAFVPLMGELVGWVSGASMASSSVIIGQSPLAGTDRPGTVALPASAHDNGTRVVAVNADPGEFESARLSPSAFLARIPRAQPLGQDDARHARREESSRGLWRYALVLLCGVLVTESVVGRRT